MKVTVLNSIRNLLGNRPAAVTAPAASTTYSLRPLTSESIDELIALNLRCFKNGENYTKHTFSYLLSQPNALCYKCVTSENVMAGFLCVLVGDEGTVHITTIAVAPEHRRRGLAEQLLEHLENAMRVRGLGSVILEVRVSNLPAQTLYKNSGYSVVQRIANYYNNGEDCFLMMKAVN